MKSLVELCRLLETSHPEPWEKGLPWDDPKFSRRHFEAHALDETQLQVQLSFLEKFTPRPGRILTLGNCLLGLGLAERGHMVLGLERGPYGVQYGQTQSKKRNLQARFRHWEFPALGELEGRFDLAVLPNGQASQLTETDLTQIMEATAKNLRNGGRLVLELPPHELPPTEKFWYYESRPYFQQKPSLVLVDRVTWPEKRLTHSQILSIDLEGRNTVSAGQTICHYSPHHILTMAKAAGLRLHGIYGDWDLIPYREGETQLILSFQKGAFK